MSKNKHTISSHIKDTESITVYYESQLVKTYDTLFSFPSATCISFVRILMFIRCSWIRWTSPAPIYFLSKFFQEPKYLLRVGRHHSFSLIFSELVIVQKWGPFWPYSHLLRFSQNFQKSKIGKTICAFKTRRCLEETFTLKICL